MILNRIVDLGQSLIERVAKELGVARFISGRGVKIAVEYKIQRDKAMQSSRAVSLQSSNVWVRM